MTKTDADSQESLSDLYQRLEARGAKPEHLTAVEDWMRRESNADAARLARLYYGRGEGEKITPLVFSWRLELLSERAYGVVNAVETLVNRDDDDKFASGTWRLVHDLAIDLDRLRTAFDLERLAAAPEPEIAGALHDAFFRHGDAKQAIERHTGPDNLPPELCEAESAALMSIATCPCEAEEVAPKFYYLLTNHRCAFGRGWRTSGAPEIMAALDFHFGRGGAARSVEKMTEARLTETVDRKKPSRKATAVS